MIGRISKFLTGFVSRYLPDPLIFAMLLTMFTFVIALALTPHTPIDMVQMWGNGFWNLLGFGMQMALIIVTGHALASSAPVKKILKLTASAAKTPAQGVMLVTFFGSVACVINWGFGLVVGAMFAREVARRVKGSDYPLLIACAYIGFLTWGGGLSGSMPLLAATPGNPVEHIAGLIPVSQTIFTGYNIFITLTLIIVMPFVTRMMMPKPGDIITIDPALLQEEADFQKKLPADAPVAEKMEESRIIAFIIGALGIAYLGMYFWEKGFNITINTVNMMFMIAGLLLHKTPMAYMRAISAATRSTAGILVQFPFYAGIQLMMEHSGLGGLITEWFISVANKDTFPIMTFFSSALINFAVPSGGGHWVIQGPFVMPAAQALGADLGKSAMAIAYGEQWMNMAQPFWALPALAIAGLGVRDIMGYCVTALLFSGLIFVIGLTVF
ncbi:TIGR00366 family protein [Pragia fontium]|uniref:Short-chain fatty acids transporter n=2 Tax=Pragia fontium TaxID=82985 RepID=A0AAJ4WDK8_9GAMM|nr:TIGR00366 family protein [Pragia fontium]AKJ43378.1 short-chain fatty acid transporter [Pragia fontium]SFD45082.1 short-chain fatty acids transporter [Pragia fontium DSM 5563 = ATCC 49100]SUB83850.1 Short-chain fatty acids transporter [Pragia fontium]VEJ56754.1 Short-chain fatty acids transporter [Pragia fontium]GKX64722.1 short-chain fatty acids transporter [Pragia fontium]